jgi:drug/metabolite transporter (DMT)-like permease
VALPVSAVVAAPFVVLDWELEAEAWPYIAASSVLELAYFALLAAAYARAELSLVYPLARGLAPVLVLAAAVTVTGAPTSAPQVLGVLLVASGVLLVRGLRRGRGAGFALAIAVSIAAYTVVDNSGVEHASPLAYLELVTILTGLGYAAGLAAVRGRPALRRAVGPRALAAGVAAFAAYGLVLTALERAPAAPVAAVRETSVVIATALGALVLRERVTRWRFAGAVLVVAGVALLGGA